MSELTKQQQSDLTHWSMWGYEGYPITKHGRSWFVRDCPKGFKTKREAVKQWENYIQLLLDKKAGRV